MLGLDTDTTAAVFGAIAGAYYGIYEVPSEWKSAISKHDIVMDYAARLHAFSLALESN